mgnify:CR=1 FL=1
MEMAERMIDFRAKHGLSVEKAAKGCGISGQAWRYIERGLQNPTRLTVQKLKIYMEKKEANESVNKSD